MDRQERERERPRHGGGPKERVSFDLSENTSPLGPPASVFRVLANSKGLVSGYPSPYPEALAKALAQAYGVPKEMLVVGSGSADLMYRLFAFLRPKKTLVLSPDFGEYPYISGLYGRETPKVLPLSKKNGFRPGFEEILRSMEGVEAFILSHPNNPVGWLLEAGGFKDFLEEAFVRPDPPWVVVDEAFIDFCPEASLKGLLGRFSRLVILRSLTKFYAIPGLRVGALLAEPALAEGLRRSMPPWPMNTIAIEASLAALQDFEYPLRLRAFIEWMRKLYLERLQALEGIEVFPGQANYLLTEIPALNGRLEAFERVLEGYRVRVRTRLSGLPETFVRLAIKGPKALEALDGALKGFLGV